MDSGQLLSYLQTGRTCSLSSYLPFFFSKGHSDAHSQPESGHRNVSDILIPAALFPCPVVLPFLSLYNQNAGNCWHSQHTQLHLESFPRAQDKDMFCHVFAFWSSKGHRDLISGADPPLSST